MPYIKQSERGWIDKHVEHWPGNLTSPGELNYAITKIVMEFLKPLDFNYTKIALVTGVLENVKQEFYRRVVKPYEQGKQQENGDVY